MEQSASSRSKDGSSTVPETSSDAENQMPPEAEKKEEKNLVNFSAVFLSQTIKRNLMNLNSQKKKETRQIKTKFSSYV